MSYYRGDYYRGDYYRGDPGFLSFLGGAMKSLGGFIPGVGSIVSSAGEAIGALGARKAPTAIVRAAPAGLGAGFFKGASTRVMTTIQKHPVLSGAGAAGVAGLAIGGGAGRALGGRAALRAAMPGVRRHRRMRVTNPKALRRAIRRTTGFAKLAMKTIHLIHPKKKVSFGGFRRKRKK